jgi:hypothetical protein
VPTHPLGSWRSFLLRTVRDDVELIRKRKSVAYRKAHRADIGQIKVEQSQDQDLDKAPSTAHSTTISVQEGVRKEEDLETISRFFATRPEEDEDEDAEVWALLTSQVRF